MTAASPATPIPGKVPIRLGLGRTSRELAQRLLKGEHLVLWGPTGSGKTTLVAAIHRRLADGACALSTVTHSLDDITRTFERAFPNVPTQGISRRAARARLWNAADREPAVLLLDHVSPVSTAMKGFLRRLRGGIAGVLLVFDVDSPRERTRLRAQHLGCLSVRIPALPSRTQRGLLAAYWPASKHPYPSPAVVRRLIRAARGRPGWIAACAELSRDPSYWCGGGVKVRVLALDTELRIRTAKRPLSDGKKPRTVENSVGALTC